MIAVLRRGPSTNDLLAAQLPDLARALARAYAAGLPLATACERAADALEEPAAGVLRSGAVAAARGRPAAEVLTPLVAVEGGALVRAAVAVCDEVGGDLVRALEAVAKALQQRERLRGEIAVATAQARFAARVVPIVPVAALGLLAVLSPTALRPLLTTPAGWLVLAASAALDLLALVVLRHIERGVTSA